jgi:hypothetical protein
VRTSAPTTTIGLNVSLTNDEAALVVAGLDGAWLSFAAGANGGVEGAFTITVRVAEPVRPFESVTV